MTQQLIPLGILTLISTACSPIEISITLTESSSNNDSETSQNTSEAEGLTSSPDREQAESVIDSPSSNLECSSEAFYNGNITVSASKP